MKPSGKIRVAVLYGGRSAEHEVSLRSATNVMQYLDKNLFEIIPLGIDKQGNWLLGNDVFTKSLAQQKIPHLLETTQTWFTPEWVGTSARQLQTTDILPHNNDPLFDVVFPAVHGTLCEDGTLQGLLELAGLPYVGSGVLSSAIGMDKDISKRLVKNAGIAIAPYLVIKQDAWLSKPQHYLELVAKELSFPVFTKPANTGSSVGITKVKTHEALQAAIDEAFRFDTKVLVEKALNIIELEVAVLESLEPDMDPIVSVVGEIKPIAHEFYSYAAKYLDEHGTELLIPATISQAIAKEAQVAAKTIFKTLECEGMARVDLFFDKDAQQIVFNEVNTLPGFTTISMYPKLMGASGINYSDLLTHLIQLAIKRFENKNQLQRSYAD